MHLSNVNFLKHHIRRTTNVLATPGGSIRPSWGELGDRAARLASGLAPVGLKPGNQTAMLAPNADRYYESLAIWWAGGIVDPVNKRSNAVESAFSQDDAGAHTLIIDPHVLPLLSDIRRLCSSLLTVTSVHQRDAGASCEPSILNCSPMEAPTILPGRVAGTCLMIRALVRSTMLSFLPAFEEKAVIDTTETDGMTYTRVRDDAAPARRRQERKNTPAVASFHSLRSTSDKRNAFASSVRGSTPCIPSELRHNGGERAVYSSPRRLTPLPGWTACGETWLGGKTRSTRGTPSYQRLSLDANDAGRFSWGHSLRWASPTAGLTISY